MKNPIKIRMWEKLLETFLQVKEISPWGFMCETDIFAVENPETKEHGYVSIMGQLGEHYAVCVYRGERALMQMWELADSPENEFGYQKFFEISQLQASFEDRGMIFQEDHNILKTLGMKFRGKNAWPLFRSFVPGMAPWFLDGSEIRFLQHALEQTLQVAMRVADDPSILEPSEDHYLLRRAVGTGDNLKWEDAETIVYTPEPIRDDIDIDPGMMDKLRQMPVGRATLEFDIFMFPTPIKEDEDRPYYPYTLVAVEPKSGMVVANDMIAPLPSLDAMWSRVAARVAKILASMESLPQRILIQSDRLIDVMEDFESELKTQFKLVSKLTNMNQFRRAFLSQMQKDGY